jgi:hypothetical protein
METPRATTLLDQAISGDRAEQLANDLGHQKSRLAIKTVVEEVVASSAFATRVKEIQLESLESTETYKKISDKVHSQVDTMLNNRNLKNRNFVITNVISGVAAVGAVAAVLVAVFK